MQNLTVILIITAGFDNLFDYPELLLNQTTTTEIRKKNHRNIIELSKRGKFEPELWIFRSVEKGWKKRGWN